MSNRLNPRPGVFWLLVLSAAIAGLYAPYLANPLVFDDLYVLDAPRGDYLPRWLSHATFDWTRDLAGDNMVWLRAGNLALHVANMLLLYYFLRRLSELVVPAGEPVASPSSGRGGLSPAWLSYFGAAIFAVHPAAVFGVGYLSQRTIVMATLFALLTWILFLEGICRNRQRWLIASAAAYLLAVLSKEHAIMAPAVTLTLFVLIRGPDWPSLARATPAFLLYGLIGAFIVYWIKFGPALNTLGSAYEPNAAPMLGMLSIDAVAAYPLSIVTQGYLFFKYLFLWLVPYPSLMAIDMREDLASGFWAWPQTAGFAAFMLYPLVAGYLLCKRGSTGLLGFAMLCPWLLFATELSTIRVQEPFVMYRSYLWMPCLIAVLPWLIRRWPARHALAAMVAVILVLVPLSWNRLATFADPVRLWDDALRLATSSRNAAGVVRILHNRGVAYVNEERYQEAIRDFDAGIALLPKHGLLYQARAVAYLRAGKYREALDDFESAIWFDPSSFKPYLGRATVYEALGKPDAARRDYARACRLGAREACKKP